MAIIDLLSTELIKVPLTSESKPAVIRELVQILKDAGKITDYDRALQDIIKREDMGSTGLELGIAVPHAKSGTVKTLTLAIGISPQGIDFQSLDGKPARLFFLMLAPPNQSGPHIEALAEIARMAKSRAFLDALMNARSSKEVMDLFQE